MKNLKTISALLITLFLGACSSSDPTQAIVDALGEPIADQAMGGAWVGSDNSGNLIFALSTDSGRLHWIAPETGEQGFGTSSVSSLIATVNYTYVAPLGFTLADGSTSASCSGSGTIMERTSFSANMTCTTNQAGAFSSSASLMYDSLYDLDSSLALIAGNYDDFGLVMNIAANGEIYEQNPDTGCVINGQINVIDSRFNAYDVSITYSSCVGDSASLNGATFAGLGILDNTEAPETAVFALTGAVGAETYSALFVMSQL